MRWLNLRCSIKVLHDLAMAILGHGNSIDQSSSTNLRRSRSEVHDQPRNKLGLIGIRERCPRRPRISAVDGNFARSLALGDSDSESQFASKVEKQALGSSILVSLLHAILVVAELAKVGALLGEAHGEGRGVDAKGGDEGEDRRVGIAGRRLHEGQQEEGDKSVGQEVDLNRCCGADNG